MNHLNETDFTALKETLQTQRNEILQITRATPDEGGTVELDQSRFGRLSRMDAIQVEAMNSEAARRRAIELARIEAALGRMDEGEYGCCVKCDEEIAIERLKVAPASPMCVECANKSERRR